MNYLSNAPTPPAPLSREGIVQYLDYALETLIARRDEIVTALRDDAAAYPVIETDEVAGDVAENARMAKALCSVAEERRAENKRPFLEGGRSVDAWFARFLAPVEAALAPIKDRLTSFGVAKETRARSAAETQAQSHQAEAERLASLAADALLVGNDASDLLKSAEIAAAAADKARALASGRSADLSRTRGTFGAVASVRTTWSFEITDFAAVPRDYLKADDSKIKAAMKPKDPRGRPIAEIPGIAWIAAQATGVR